MPGSIVACARSRTPPSSSRGNQYAVIISGGVTPPYNHVRYWNNCSVVYKVLVDYYGYADENITAIISDGLNPAPDRSDSTNSPPDLDGDGDDDVQYAATYSAVCATFAELAEILQPEDQFFIFTTDHGASQGGHDCYPQLWLGYALRDDQLASLVSSLQCQTILGCLTQCFSGGMIDDLASDGRVITTACDYDETASGMWNLLYSEYSFHCISAVCGQDPFGRPVDADTARLLGPINGAYLVMDNMVIDDDLKGLSRGNGNGVVEGNETIELHVALRNIGDEEARSVEAALETASPYVGLVTASATFGSTAPGQSAPGSQPFVFHVLRSAPDSTGRTFCCECQRTRASYRLS